MIIAGLAVYTGIEAPPAKGPTFVFSQSVPDTTCTSALTFFALLPKLLLLMTTTTCQRLVLFGAGAQYGEKNFASRSALPAALDVLLELECALENEADAALDLVEDVALELVVTGLPHFTPFAHIVH
jgi:hypothetical protein